MKNLINDFKEFRKIRKSREESRKLLNSQDFHDTFQKLVTKVLDESKQQIIINNDKRKAEFIKNNPPIYNAGDEVMINKWYCENLEVNISKDLLSTYRNIKHNAKFFIDETFIHCESYYQLNDLLTHLLLHKDQIREGILRLGNISPEKMHDVIYNDLKIIANDEMSCHIYKDQFYNMISLDFQKSDTRDRHGSIVFITWNDFDEKSFIDCRDTELVDCVNIYVNANEEIKRQNIILENVKDELRGRLNSNGDDSWY